MLHLGLLLLLSWVRAEPAAAPPAPADAPDTTDAMAEGAALKLGEAARTLADTAASIARTGRIGQLGPLRSDADALADRAERLLAILAEQEASGRIPPRPPPPTPTEAPSTSAPTDPPVDASPAPRPPDDAPETDGSDVPESPPRPSVPPRAPVVAPAGAPGGAPVYAPPVGAG